MIETSRVFAQSRNLTDDSCVCFGWIAANVIVSSVDGAFPANGAADEPRAAEARSADASDGSIRWVRPVRPKLAQAGGRVAKIASGLGGQRTLSRPDL